MEHYIMRPSIERYPGIKVTPETNIRFQNDKVKQTIRDLKLKTLEHISGEGYNSVRKTTIDLQDGDLLLFEEDGRGYIKPVQPFCEVSEAISDLEILNEVI